MNANLTPTSSMVRRGRVAVAVLAAAMALAAGCGSDDTATTNTAKPAGAKENTTTAKCTDWMDKTANPKEVTCAIGARGPGGGRIFYGYAYGAQGGYAFLEVAPQTWNLAIDKLLDCPGSGAIGSSCGSSDKDTIPKKTSDVREGLLEGWRACTETSEFVTSMSDGVKMPFPADRLPAAIGTGKDNTDKMIAVAGCTAANPTNTEKNWSAFQKAANYRGGGLSDWFIPSKNELIELCKYNGPTERNAIGGFPGEKAEYKYLSSTTRNDSSGVTLWTRVFFNGTCDTDEKSVQEDVSGPGVQSSNLVRPIRVFSR